MEQLFFNQSIYRLRRLDNQRTKRTAAGATGRAREFCWLLESDWTRAVWHFNLNHLEAGFSYKLLSTVLWINTLFLGWLVYFTDLCYQSDAHTQFTLTRNLIIIFGYHVSNSISQKAFVDISWYRASVVLGNHSQEKYTFRKKKAVRERFSHVLLPASRLGSSVHAFFLSKGNYPPKLSKALLKELISKYN